MRIIKRTCKTPWTWLAHSQCEMNVSYHCYWLWINYEEEAILDQCQKGGDKQSLGRTLEMFCMC